MWVCTFVQCVFMLAMLCVVCLCCVLYVGCLCLLCCVFMFAMLCVYASFVVCTKLSKPIGDLCQRSLELTYLHITNS